MFWRTASKRWKAKGYTLTDIADRIDEEFGPGRKLGRSTIGTLVTTVKEDVPPDVLTFLEALPVLDEKKWAAYLRETVNAPADERTSEPAQAAKVDAEALEARLASRLDAAFAALDANLDSVLTAMEVRLEAIEGKLDEAGSTLKCFDAKLDEAESNLGAMETGLEKLTKEVVAAVPQPEAFARAVMSKTAPWFLGLAGLLVLGFVLLIAHQRGGQDRASPVGKQFIAEQYRPEGEVETSGWDGGAELSKLAMQALPISKGPVPGQWVAPCPEGIEEINGNCWMRYPLTPAQVKAGGCDVWDQYEPSDGWCRAHNAVYRPYRGPKRKNTSVDQ